MGSRSERNLELLPLWDWIVMLSGERLWRNNAGISMLGIPTLLGPPSITSMERLGSAFDSLEAIMQPAVPPT